jgi:fluoroacetyl-CoA thioesterase
MAEEANMDWPVGRSNTTVVKVEESYLASNWGNDVGVLATPILLWLAEIACMKVIEQHLPKHAMTVGLAHEARHLAPTPCGFTVELKATLLNADGKILRFKIEATDGQDEVFSGEHTRAVIDAERFRKKVADKAQAAGLAS